MTWKGWLAAGIGLVTVVACSDTVIDPPEDGAELRLIHASAGSGSVDLEIGGQVVIRGVPYGKTSPLVVVPSGAQHLVVRTGNSIIGTIDGTLSSARVNSVVVSGGAAQLASVVDGDTGSVAPNRANIRLVTVATTNTAAPTLLHALFNWAGLPDSTIKFGLDATVARYGTLMYFDPGNFTIKYVAQGTTTPIVAQAAFSVAAGEKKALVLSRLPDGTYHVEVVTEQ